MAEDVREKRRIVHDTLARVAGLTFLFPLNLLLLAFLFARPTVHSLPPTADSGHDPRDG